MVLHCDVVCAEGVQEGTMVLAPLSADFQSLLPATHRQSGPFWCWFPYGWVCICLGTLWVSPTNSPVRLGVSSAAASTPTGVFNQWFEALFPRARALGLVGLCHSLVVPPSLSVHECGTAESASHHLATSPLCPDVHIHPSYWSGWMCLL